MYRILFDSVVPPHSISQPIPVRKNHKSLFTNERNGKVKLFVNSIPITFVKFASRYLRVHLQTGLKVYTKS